jgi:hypothetical protein
MQGHDKKTEELIANIKSRIEEITSGEIGMLVYLKEVVFPEGNGRGASQSMITVSCLFLSEEGSICADLFRTGIAGFMECVYGSMISGISKRGLEEINSALMDGRWYISEIPGDGSDKEKKKISRKKSLHVPFKLSMLMRGA